ncbi:uncharacterized protein LY89DRAFT_738869 [Mollisia scopiformis]|uniref:Uncharacterized protein n=1 Tax=Mollisia scopiformis TaxID=149040 RepID=A0A194WUU0_MOLSC|nr:uncharacterized protein LY89DRAFT_738869 [Mollisia scopiformis]KUJ11429.1 hypothetical protein LY89DRAFT_738869 [Mollisia scopiformis]
MPNFPITARADPTPVYRTLTQVLPSTTIITTILLGDSPAATAAPSSSSDTPSNGTVIGAVIGSIFGFILILMLISYCVRRTPDWAPYFSDRSSFSSVYVHNPNAVPTQAHVDDPTATTRLGFNREKRQFYFERESQRSHSAPPVSTEYSDTSASSQSS